MKNNWKKLGLITAPIKDIGWMSTFASSTAVNILDEQKGIIEIFVTGRDNNNRSLIGKIIFDVFNHKIITIDQKASLNLGPLSSFDENGQSYPCIVNENDHDKLYYTGWSPSVLTPFQNFPGLAIRRKGDEIFKRTSNAPVMGRNHDDYNSIGSLCVIKDEGLYKMWYTNFRNWEKNENGPKHYYNIKYAYSKDGINWERDNITCIDFINSEEYAIAKPTVIKTNDTFHMYYCYRGNKYKIGYAISQDGINWNRKDHESGISLSESGWDSKEINYPTIFKLQNKIFMLYSGNDYGKAGFGIAKKESFD